MVLPDTCADGLFVWETTLPFVSYLNWAFREGGFPWQSGEVDQWAGGATPAGRGPLAVVAERVRVVVQMIYGS